MANIEGNIATSGAKQSNSVFDICFQKNVHLNFISRPTHVAAAQDFGSPLETRYSYRPLQELIRAFDAGEIEEKRFHGQKIYEKMTGKIMTMYGDVQDVSMDEMMDVDGEASTNLGTIIVCLSVPLTKTALSSLVASAIMLYMQNTIDRSMEGTIQILQGKIEKYAGSVISRDGMCNKLENAKQRVYDSVKNGAPHLHHYNMFLPPLLPAEEQDLVAFIVQLWSSKADGQKIFTRSIKLLALALLLSEYGWHIDVFVETNNPESPESPKIIPIKTDTGALSVIYSSISTTAGSSRVYIENHEQYPLGRGDKYPTAVCKAIHMGETSGLSLSRTMQDQEAFMRGYNTIDDFCMSRFEFKVTVNDDGLIKMQINGTTPAPSTFSRGCRALLARFIKVPPVDLVMDLIVGALCEMLPEYDWGLLDDEIKTYPYPRAAFTVLLSDSPSECEQIWVVAGAVLAILDKIVTSLVNIPTTSLIRTPAGQSIEEFVQRGNDILVSLVDGTVDPSLAVQFCATRLAGVNSRTIGTPHSADTRIIGYWSGQQGLLLTPVFERSLYYDLPQNKIKPVTFFNIPIMGMATDERGWIRSGSIPRSFSRSGTFSYDIQRSCDVVIEYRPHFEEDSRSVVAAVYLDGVFHNVFALSQVLSSRSFIFSNCSHSIDVSSRRKAPKHLTLKSLQPGETMLPSDQEIHIIIPQQTAVSRWFCSMAYRNQRPVIQNGCLDCAIIAAEEDNRRIIIPRVKNYID